MFSSTRKRLAIYFAALMVLFLLTINVVSYALLSSMIYKDREQELLRLSATEVSLGKQKLDVLEETRKHETNQPIGYKLEHLESDEHEHDEDEHNDDEHDDEERDREQLRRAGIALQPFSFVLDESGNPLIGDEGPSRLQRAMLAYLQGWAPKTGEIRYETFEYDDKDLRFAFTGQQLFEDRRYLGVVYTGIDITQESNVLRKYMVILLALSGVFLIISGWLGYLMAGRAMKPIIRAFANQQQFTADASHELRTPLSVILSSLEVIESEEKAGFSPFSRQVLDDLKDEVKRMSQLVANLLTLARADSSDIQLHLERFSLHEELERIYRTFQPVAHKHHQELHLVLPKRMWIRADRERIAQLLLILLDNAVQYSEGPGQITLSADVSGKMAAISVKDTGRGIPPEKQKDIFERFYRVDSARNRDSHHAGLGLSIAMWIAQAHRGTITLVSEPGRGSTFTVLIPLLEHKGADDENFIG